MLHHRTTKRMLYSRLIKLHVLTLFGWLIFAACQSAATPAQSPPINPEDPLEFRELLFKADDLGWPVDSYDTRQDDDLKPFQSEPMIVVAAGATARSNPINPKTGLRYRDDLLAAAQILFVYPDKQSAVKIFEEFETRDGDLYISTGSYKPESIQFKSKVDNISWACWKIGGSKYENCTILVQHDRYVTTAGMTVDGEIIAFADFEVFINVIQDRLLDQVAKES